MRLEEHTLCPFLYTKRGSGHVSSYFNLGDILSNHSSKLSGTELFDVESGTRAHNVDRIIPHAQVFFEGKIIPQLPR